MCRRCGEPDKRGSSRDRRARKLWMLATRGGGVTCPCVWCDTPLTLFTLQADRLIPGGPYARWNVRPSCAACNRSRWYSPDPIPEACQYG